ncbi:MAG: dicarboxylate/amino acid:cation symporter [Gammaproteobacteria bacterium]
MFSDRLQNIEQIHPKPLKRLSAQLYSLVEKRLWLKVLIAMVLGLAVGIIVGPTVGIVRTDLSILIGNWLALPGQLFLATIQMIVIPLVFASIILGIASSEDVNQLKKLGSIVSIYFIITTAIAALIGIVVALISLTSKTLSIDISPATSPSAQAIEPIETVNPPRVDDLPQVLIELLPGNPLSSMVEGQMLQIVIFALIFGIALVAMPPTQSKPLLELLGSLQQVCMMIVKWAMWLAPIAVFGLMARLTSQVGINALIGMLHYVLTVIFALLLLLLFYLILIYFFTRQNPIQFLKATRELLLLAFSTSSSAAVMPLSIKTAEEKLGIRGSISQFVIPLGATINMNGTALYQAVATIFLAQVYGVDISISGMLLIVTMAVGASIGSPATPGVGIVILATILNTVGIPPEGIALILGVDRILDMSRTSINVAGDIVAAKLMNKWIGHDVIDSQETLV